MPDYGSNPISALADDPVLVEMRRRFTYAQDEWREIREEGRRDMQVVAGDPWDPKDKRQRIDAGRPALSLDEIGQYVNQLVNDVREHSRAIEVTPLGDGANDDTAEFRQNLIRQIEYRSKAQDAYTTGFENAVQRSYGFWRINSRYVTQRLTKDDTGHLSPALLDQELVIEPIVNPDLVMIDPDFQRPDGSDMRYAFVYEQWPIADYRKKWPNAVVRDSAPDLIKTYKGWFRRDSVMVTEYWTITNDDRVAVYADADGNVHEAASEDDVPEGAKWRWVEQPKVKKYLSNGVEILEEQDWPGTQIPIVCDFGKMLYMDDGGGPKRVIMSLVRLARDPAMLYCYYRTCEAELVGMTPKFPYFVWEGSMSPAQFDNLQKSLSEPIAAVQVKPMLAQGGQTPSFPERQPYEPPIQALEMGAEAARRAIQAAMGSMPLPTQAQKQNEKSGVALDKIADSTQHGTYHFIDHYEAAITRTGVLLEELIPHFYDMPRTVAVRKANGEVTQQRINDVPTPGGPSIAVDEADHDVTLSTGPSYQSERVASDEFASQIVNELQGIAGIAGPKAAAKILARTIKLRNIGPIGDEMAEIIDPPDPTNLPPQIAQQLQALQQENQQLKMQIQTDTAKIQAKGQVDAQTTILKGKIDMAKASADAQVKLQIADMTSGRAAQAGLVEAEIKAGNADADRRIQVLELMLNIEKELRLKAQEGLDEKALTASEQTHRMVEKAHDHAHEHAMADKTHANTLEQAAQAVALAPPPQTTDGASAS